MVDANSKPSAKPMDQQNRNKKVPSMRYKKRGQVMDKIKMQTPKKLVHQYPKSHGRRERALKEKRKERRKEASNSSKPKIHIISPYSATIKHGFKIFDVLLAAVLGPLHEVKCYRRRVADVLRKQLRRGGKEMEGKPKWRTKLYEFEFLGQNSPVSLFPAFSLEFQIWAKAHKSGQRERGLVALTNKGPEQILV